MDSTIPQPEPRSNKLEVSLEVFEDVVEELEDFVYLARLGYTHEAHIQYEEALRSHQDRWCPILIEYIDMLLSTGYLTEASTMLQRYRQHHFDGAINHHYRLVLESMLELVDDETYKRRYSKMSSEGIRKEVMYIAGELDGITESACRDGDFIIPTV